jgi:DUF177 domain-containing protein
MIAGPLALGRPATLESMPQRTDSLDLGGLRLSPGEGRRLQLHAGHDPLVLSGQRYSIEPASLPVTLDISRMTAGGYALRLRFEARLRGPCMRCLGAADPTIAVDAREVDQAGAGEELDSPYVSQAELDLRGWVRDALALALPSQLVCRADCAGLCPVCGADLNLAGADHAHEREPDPRWAKLRELRLE